MWFIRAVMVVSLFIMLIWSSESKPQGGLADHLSDTQFLAALDQSAVKITISEQQCHNEKGTCMELSSGSSCDGTSKIIQNSGEDLCFCCILPEQDNGSCKCVPFNLCCDTGGTTDGAYNLEGKIDLRIFPNSSCKNVLELCCDKVCNSTRPKAPPDSSNDECGISNPNGVGVHIEGFKEGQAQFGEYPWMVAVLDQQTTYVAGGSLVHPNIVLTAAHKVKDKANCSLVARIGDWDLSAEKEEIANQNIIVESILIHPKYNQGGTLANDVALLILQKKATLGPTVRTICLPQTQHNFDKFEGKNCIVSGWGKDVFGKTGKYQQIMKEVIVPAVSHSECQRMLRNNTNVGPDFLLHNTFNCAGANGKDACTGDGGSPLACKDPNNADRYVQMGVVAWGKGCGIVGVPGVYGSIPKTVEWISQIIQEEGVIKGGGIEVDDIRSFHKQCLGK